MSTDPQISGTPEEVRAMDDINAEMGQADVREVFLPYVMHGKKGSGLL